MVEETPKQRDIAKLKSRVNVQEFRDVFNWMNNNNNIFKEFHLPDDVAPPTIIQDRQNRSNIDD